MMIINGTRCNLCSDRSLTLYVRSNYLVFLEYGHVVLHDTLELHMLVWTTTKYMDPIYICGARMI